MPATPKALEAAIAAHAPVAQLAAIAFDLAVAEQLEGKDAAATLERALDWRTAAFGEASAEAFEVLLTLASEHARQGRDAEATAALDELIRRAPAGSDEQVRALAMAGAFYTSTRAWAQALGPLQRALDLASGEQRRDLLHAVGRTRLELGDDGGRALLAEAAATGSGPAAIDLADVLAAKGELAEAIKVLEQGAKSPDKRWAIECSSRLSALLRLGDRAGEAEGHAREAVLAADELDPRHAPVLALFELAAVQAKLGKNTDALRVLQRALEAVEKDDPRDEYAWAQAQLRVGSHLLYGFAARESDALPYLNRALGALSRVDGSESPECADVLVHVAVAMMRKGDVRAAKGIAARAAALFEKVYGPGNPYGKGAAELAAHLEKLGS